MHNQIEYVAQRDGKEAAVEYAKRALRAYRGVARYRNPEKQKLRHFCHALPYRPHFVRGIIEIRRFLKQAADKPD
jgi:hypothetical protein